ncbi:MAG: peptidase S41, partial [Alloprevotella tannerae]|nr:peptidase S41 [Alloprevotella tannerae]
MQTIKIPNEIIIPQFKQLLDEGHTVRFRVRGFSMRPFLEDRRDIVTLTPLSKDPEVGDAILAEVAPQTYVL